jgi:glycosyltransferase involved in cell wall biosynthesis
LIHEETKKSNADKAPVLSIIMLAYNAEHYVKEAIESALSQEFHNFELIVVDDGSTDNTYSIVESFRDERLKIHRNEVNKGIVFSRNKGIALSSGRYIGMLDADDVAMPGKFRKQLEFLESNPEFGMVGSWALLIDSTGKETGELWKLSGEPEKIPAIMLFKNYFVQSSVVFRRSCLPSYNYKEGYEIVEDYKLWIDIMKHSKAWNLPEYLVKYRVHGTNITHQKAMLVRENLIAVYRELLGQFGIDPTDEEIELHHMIREGRTISDPLTFRAASGWLSKLQDLNASRKIFGRKEFAEVLLNRWGKVAWMARGYDRLFFLRFLKSKIITEYLVSRVQRNYA